MHNGFYEDEQPEQPEILVDDAFSCSEDLDLPTDPLVVPHNIDELIAQHMLNIFNRYRDTNIPGTITIQIKADASSGARELAVENVVTVGPWDKSATFKSQSLSTSFNRAVARYREQETFAVKALPAY